MNQTLRIIARLWVFTAILFALFLTIYICFTEQTIIYFVFPVSLVIGLIASIPGFIVLFVGYSIVRKSDSILSAKLPRLLFFQFIIASLYGLAGTTFTKILFGSNVSFIYSFSILTLGLFASSSLATLFSISRLVAYFSRDQVTNVSFNNAVELFSPNNLKSNFTMEQLQNKNTAPDQSNRILIKGLITGGLILLMLIPTIFIQNLISERQQRQKEVVEEVNSKWASAQNLSGPFLSVPYTYFIADKDGKMIPQKTNVIMLPKNLNVQSTIFPEQRTRSIYKVLLYKSTNDFDGAFNITIPVDIDKEKLEFQNARLCIALTDFMGIEEEVNVNFNGEKLLLNPGLPVNEFGTAGLSIPIHFSAEDLQKPLPFKFQIKIKGSEQLHFMPLSATALFKIRSSWPSPSFDGKLLPSQRSVSDNGFKSEWRFNHANLPFGTVFMEGTSPKTDIAFGVSLVQPASQYDKTSRSVKYAILFIGLTFAFFFIIELLQKKPFHPVQYVLVGMALVIFYTLLLSISEYIQFDYAYMASALSTLLLITFYAKGHFRSWKTAGIFFCLLSALYGFIFVLISLEDTALIVGSIGLFIILALAMYASRKINWYGRSPVELDLPVGR